MEKGLYVLNVSHEERRKRRKGESYHTYRFYHIVMPQASTDSAASAELGAKGILRA
jgi:hypothetical protein